MIDIMQNPLVSVIIPAYNHEKYILAALESVINQSYKNIQLIVINDGSKDKTANIIQSFVNSHIDRDILFINKVNEGVSKTLNLGLSKVEGCYVAFLASDDFWELDKMEKQVKYLEMHPENSMVFTDAYILYEDNFINHKWSQYKPELRKLFNSGTQNKNLYSELMIHTVIPASTVTLKMSSILKVGGFDPKLAIEDDDLWWRIAREFPIGYLDEPLAFYREHANNISKNSFYMLKGYLLALRKHFKEPPLLGKPFVQLGILIRVGINLFFKRIKRILYYNSIKISKRHLN